jgi:hypothetical protein
MRWPWALAVTANRQSSDRNGSMTTSSTVTRSAVGFPAEALAVTVAATTATISYVNVRV